MRNALLLAGLSALALAGCGGKKNVTANPTPGAPPPTPGSKTFKIGYSQSTLQDPWRKAMNSELETEEKNHPNAKVLKQDAQNVASNQVNQVENLNTQGIDALMISPVESAPLTPEVTKIYKKGIPVILLDRATDNDQYTSLVGADNVLIGKMAGEYVKKAYPKGAKIIEIAGIAGATPTKERAKGFREGIGNDPKYSILASQPGNYLRGKAIEVFQTMFTAHPDVEVVYAHNDEMALGASGVLDKAGKLKDVAVIGVDGQKEAIQAVAAGKMAATFVYPRPGADGLKAALDALNGKKVEKRIVLPTTEITKANAAANLTKGF
ncbi:MAG TPA: substrate-binding domain-containing protein [Armatimonadota bacterium]|jgi:ribose transport system substrate-binding protein